MRKPVRQSVVRAVGAVAGGVGTARQSSPDAARAQARHHFTRLDQINQLVGASEADADLGFMGRLLALCSLPRTNPGDRKEYVRTKRAIQAGNGRRDGKTSCHSATSRACSWRGCARKPCGLKAANWCLAGRCNEFMRKLGMEDRSGSARGDRTRLQNQMQRLFRCTVSLVYKDAQLNTSVSSLIADRTDFWWSARQPNAPALWESRIELGEKFFNEIIAHPIPLDMNILRAIKRSPLGLDLYMWLTYRTFSLKGPLRLSWRQLYRQFGRHPAKASDPNTGSQLS